MSVKRQVTCGQQSHTLVENRQLRRKRNKGLKASEGWWQSLSPVMGQFREQLKPGQLGDFFFENGLWKPFEGQDSKALNCCMLQIHGIEGYKWLAPVSFTMHIWRHIPFRSIHFLDLRFSYLRGPYPTLWVTGLQESFSVGIINILILLFSFSSAAACGTWQ